MSLSDLRKELRDMRKESMKPVSKMKKGDCAMEIEKMKSMRETVPAIATTLSAASKKMAPKKDTVKKMKEAEMPMAPMKAAPKPKKGGMSKAQMRAMLDELTSDEEE